jgi:P27 family predicted phage terminase small subunit
MAPRGQKPKPVERHRLEGTFRPSRHAKPPLRADGRRPPQPAGLFAEAQAAWRQLVAELERERMLHRADRFMLEAAAVALGRARQARRIVAREGLIARGDRGDVTHPALRIERAALAELRLLLDSSGLSATSRARLGLAGEPDQEPFAAIGPSPRHRLRAVDDG